MTKKNMRDKDILPVIHKKKNSQHKIKKQNKSSTKKHHKLKTTFTENDTDIISMSSTQLNPGEEAFFNDFKTQQDTTKAQILESSNKFTISQIGVRCINCKQIGNVRYQLIQKRGGDECSSAFFACQECNHSWRCD